MVLEKRTRAAAARGGSVFSTGRVFTFVFLVGAFVMFLFFRQYGAFEGGDRMAGAKKYAESMKEFFVAEPVKYKVYDIPLMIRSQDLGSEFYGKTFPSFIRAAQDETDKLLAFEDIINRKDEKGEHRAIDLSAEPRLFALLKQAKDHSEKSLYNIAAGDIFDFWDIAVHRYENWKKAKEQHFAITQELRTKKTELAAEEKKKKEEDLARLEKILAKDRFLPDMKSLKDFIPYAKPSAIEIDDENKTVRIASANVRIRLKFFREALFLDNLRAKLPTQMKYLIYYGDRHGMWSLPKEYVRWTISVDDPQVLLGDRSLGAVKLAEEKGSWAVARINEDVVVQDGRFYPMPIDWRTGLPTKHNLAALTIAADAVTARMDAYALFIAAPEERQLFEKNFPGTPYVVVARQDVVQTGKFDNDPRTAEYLTKLTATGDPMTRQEILTALVEFETKNKIAPDGAKVATELSYVERKAVLVVPAVTKDRFVSKEEIAAAREKRLQKTKENDPFKRWQKERPDDK
ncbi:MAG TPA: FAD:protein FMN transferase [bacterium]|nr:FAD:protein FMN transferase [bacterium]